MSRGIDKRVAAALDESGATLIRNNKHFVYRFPNGRTVTLSSTTSDSKRSAANQLRDIRRAVEVL